MNDVLPLLIEKATRERDRQLAQLAQAQLSLTQGQATLQRLRQFRTEYLARSPTATLGRSDGEALAQAHRFLGRLDEAIALQQQETGLRRTRVAAQQEQLMQRQQRLLAFETLAQRRHSERELRQQRRLQGEADEFAARVASHIEVLR